MATVAHRITCNPLPSGNRKPESVGIVAGREIATSDRTPLRSDWLHCIRSPLKDNL